MRHVKAWYSRHREAVHCSLLAVLAFIIAVITGQMFYPYGRTLPGISIDGRNVGSKDTAVIAKDLERRYDAATIVLKAGEHTFTMPAKHIGIEVVADPTATQAAEYTLSERLVPFSFIGKMDTDIRPVLRFDDVRLLEFAATVSKQAVVEPQSAGITVQDGGVALKPAVPGHVYRVSDIMQQLHSVALQPKTVLTLRAQTKQPVRTDAAVRPVLEAAQRVVDATLTLQVSDEKITIDKKTLAGWIDFKESQDGTVLELVMKPDAVKAYLQDLQSRINRSPGTTTINLLDGQTVARTDGVAGFGVDIDKSAAMIAERLPTAEATLNLPLISLPAVVTYNRTYSDTQKGLDALVTDVSVLKSNASIVVIELGGQNRQSRVGGDKVWAAASNYKLYVAYAVFKQIAAERLAWDEPISYGKDVNACFESMIVLSDNVCAAAFLDKIGRSTIQDMVRGIGLSGTTLVPANYTTANDLALFLTKLENGSLLDSASRSKLLDAMRRQIYRAGIPTGASAPVANKVGYVYGVRHDAGIVYSPGGTYIEVIMTNGLEWPTIADAARRIDIFMNR